MKPKGYWKKYYSDPEKRDLHLASVRATRAKRREEVKIWLNERKLKLGCKVCGFKEHPSALEFDHRDPKKKEFALSEAMRLGYTLAKVKQEASKCDVLCANHHRMRHAGVFV